MARHNANLARVCHPSTTLASFFCDAGGMPRCATAGKNTCHPARPRLHVNNRLGLGAEELAVMLQPSGITRDAIAASWMNDKRFG